MVLGLVACQKEVLVDSDTNFVGQELSKLSNIPAPEFTITTYDTSPGNINTNVSCTFNVLCDGLASGASSFSTTLNSAGQYSAFGFVGETYVNNPIWFNHAQTYLLLPTGTFPKNGLYITYNSNYVPSNMPSITYNKYKRKWVVNGGSNFTYSIHSFSSGGDLPC